MNILTSMFALSVLTINFCFSYGNAEKDDQTRDRREAKPSCPPNRPFYYNDILRKCCPCSECPKYDSYSYREPSCETYYAPQVLTATKALPICRSIDSSCVWPEDLANPLYPASTSASIRRLISTTRKPSSFKGNTTSQSTHETMQPLSSLDPGDPATGVLPIHWIAFGVSVAVVFLILFVVGCCCRKDLKKIRKKFARCLHISSETNKPPPSSPETAGMLTPQQGIKSAAEETKTPDKVTAKEVEVPSKDVDINSKPSSPDDGVVKSVLSSTQRGSEDTKAVPFETGREGGSTSFSSSSNLPSQSNPLQPTRDIFENSVNLGGAYIQGNLSIQIAPSQGPMSASASHLSRENNSFLPPGNFSFSSSSQQEPSSSPSYANRPQTSQDGTPYRETRIMQNNFSAARQQAHSSASPSFPHVESLRGARGGNRLGMEETHLRPFSRTPQENESILGSGETTVKTCDSSGVKLPTSSRHGETCSDSREDSSITTATSQSASSQFPSRLSSPIQETTSEDSSSSDYGDIRHPPSGSYATWRS